MQFVSNINRQSFLYTSTLNITLLWEIKRESSYHKIIHNTKCHLKNEGVLQTGIFKKLIHKKKERLQEQKLTI